MQLSDKGREVLERLEGSRSKAYKDSAGYLTIGIGHLLTRSELTSGKIIIGDQTVRWPQGLSKGEIGLLLDQDLGEVFETLESEIEERDEPVELNQNQIDALASFIFNVGRGAFMESTLLKKIDDGDFDEVPAQFRRWHRAGSRVKRSLVARREVEIRLWNGEEPFPA